MAGPPPNPCLHRAPVGLLFTLLGLLHLGSGELPCPSYLELPDRSLLYHKSPSFQSVLSHLTLLKLSQHLGALSHFLCVLLLIPSLSPTTPAIVPGDFKIHKDDSPTFWASSPSAVLSPPHLATHFPGQGPSHNCSPLTASARGSHSLTTSQTRSSCPPLPWSPAEMGSPWLRPRLVLPRPLMSFVLSGSRDTYLASHCACSPNPPFLLLLTWPNHHLC